MASESRSEVPGEERSPVWSAAIDRKVAQPYDTRTTSGNASLAQNAPAGRPASTYPIRTNHAVNTSPCVATTKEPVPACSCTTVSKRWTASLMTSHPCVPFVRAPLNPDPTTLRSLLIEWLTGPAYLAETAIKLDLAVG